MPARRCARSLVIAVIPAVMLAIAALAAACGGDDNSPATPSSTPSAASPTAASPRTVTPTPPAPADTPLPPDGSTSSDDTPRPATPTIAVPGDRDRVPAPIVSADIVIRESAPPQYAVHVVSGLPNGCTLFAGITHKRVATEVTITVENSVPRDQNIACTQIYGMHDETVELGSNFTPGTTYTVHVNDTTLTFDAH